MGEVPGDTTVGLPYDVGRASRVAAARTELPDWVVDCFEWGMFRTDRVVDAVVADFAKLAPGVGWRMLDDALRSVRPTVDGAPPSLEALLTPMMATPEWFDAEQIKWSAAVWWRFFPANQIGLSGAVRTGYRFGDLNKPQAMNGRSEKMAARRYEETARWLLSATEPGALAPGGAGFNDTVKIRLVHAVIRRRLRGHIDWNRTAWGEPIHTTGMAITNNAFLTLPLTTAALVGIEFSADEREAIRALWHWIGYLMGVPEELLPTSIERAELLNAAALKIFAPPDQDSQIMDAALLRAGIRAERLLPSPLQPVVAPILRPLASRAVWGTTNTILNRIEQHPDDPSQVHHPLLTVLRPIVARRERRRRKGRLGTDFDIARRQRTAVESALTLIKAAPSALQPSQAGAGTR